MKHFLEAIFKSRVGRNSLWLYALQIANTVLPLITIPYVTRILTAEGYGEFSIAYNWITYCQIVVEYGFILGGARKVALLGDDKDAIDKLFKSIFTARLLLSLIAFIGLSIVCSVVFVNQRDVSTIFNALILFIIVFSIVFQTNWLFQGKQEMKYISIINIIARVLSVCLIFAFVRTQGDVYLYSFFYSVTFLFSSVLGCIIACKKYGVSLKVVHIKDAWFQIKDDFPLFTSAAISKVFGAVGMTILAFYASKTIVGCYNAIFRIPTVLTLMFAPISQSLFPFFSDKIGRNDQSVGKTRFTAFCFIFSFFLIVSILIIAFRNIIVTVAFGEKDYQDYSNLVLFLVPQVLFGIINNFLGVQTLVAEGKKNKYQICIAISSAVLVVLNLVLCPFMLAYGTALASLISEIILMVVLLLFVFLNRRNVQNAQDSLYR